MDKILISKCREVLSLLADENVLKIALSLAKKDKNIETLVKDTQLKEDVVKEKVVDLVKSNILRYRNDKNSFTLADAHICTIVNCVEDKAKVEMFNEREV